MGGDEFGVLAEVQGSRGAGLLATKLARVLNESFAVGGRSVAQAASVGVALLSTVEGDLEVFTRAADSAMYAAKAHGRQQVRFHTEDMERELRDRLRLEELLAGALGRDELAAHYQPIFSLRRDCCTGYEALMRWTCPELQLDVVAEGVETRAQLDFLKGSDCARAQGYFLGRPVAESDL